MSFQAHAYSIFGTDGSILSPMTQTKRDQITFLTTGVLIFNQDNAEYEMWDGARWISLTAGGSGGGTGAGGGLQEVYRGITYQAPSPTMQQRIL